MTGETDSAAARREARTGGTALLRPLFLLTAAGTLALDLGSKAWAWAFFDRYFQETSLQWCWVVPPWFRLYKAWNTGTIWGLFQDQTSVLIGVRIAMVLGIVALVWTTRAGERLKQLALGLVLGGALGNLYDNLTQPSRGVRDFLDFHIPLPWRDEPWHYPTFNLADASILCGAVLLFFAFGGERKPAAKASAPAAAAPPEPE
jgi:signal peptidase II